MEIKSDKWDELIRIIDGMIMDAMLTGGNSVFSDAFRKEARVRADAFRDILDTVKRLRRTDES